MKPPAPPSTGRPRSGPGPWLWAGVAAVFAGLLAMGIWWIWPGEEDDGIRATLSATAALAGPDTVGYARATEPREFVFPADHGAHPDYRTEWWYLTGNLEDASGRRFGYQLTFFRNSLSPDPPDGSSAWSTNQLWMGHLGLTDVQAGIHLHTERFARGAAGLAGAVADPFRVWIEDWELQSLSAGADGSTELETDPKGAQDVFPLALTVRHGELKLELQLESARPPVLQGEEGLSRKGPEPGNASYYLSFTRLPTQGTIQLGEDTIRVEGLSWMDREWSTSPLDEIHEGWDWFSLQLDDGRDLMFFQLRREDGKPEALNHGVLVEPDGTYRTLDAHEVEVEVLARWASPLDGALYPSRWRLCVPEEGIAVTVEPVLDDQEMNLSIRYWEGAVDVRGRGPDGPVRGRGFVEMTGYGSGPIPPGESMVAVDGSARDAGGR